MIQTGSPAVRVSFFKTRKVSDGGAIEKGLEPEKAFIAFHLDCHKQQHSAWLDNWFEKHPRKVRARGRPKKYIDPSEVVRLKALIYYYKKAGNWDKVTELEARVEKLVLTGGARQSYNGEDGKMSDMSG